MLWDGLSKPRAAAPGFRVFALLRVLSDAGLATTLVSMTNFDNGCIDDLTEALRMMMLSPWWQRVWVIQEVVVSKQAIVRYGILQSPWEMFVAASRHITTSHYASFSPQSSKVLQHFARKIQSFERLREE